MKLAEALLERADLQKRVTQMNQRLRGNARVQEGEKPAENPQELLRELFAMTDRLEELVAAINLTNSQTIVDGETLTRLLARRDVWQQRIQMQRDFLEQASALVERARMSEIKIISTVNVAKTREELDAQAKALRLLDTKIQAANWATELREI